MEPFFEFLTTVAFFGIVVGLPSFLLFGLPLILRHRRQIDPHLHERLTQANALTERVAHLERRCGELEQQVKTAHDLLADEQRTLDRKLNAILPGTEESTASKTIGPERGERVAEGNQS